MVRQLVENLGVDDAARHISSHITGYNILFDFDNVGIVPYHVLKYFAANDHLQQLFQNVHPCTLKFEKQQEDGLKYDDSIIGTVVPHFCMRVSDWERMGSRTKYRYAHGVNDAIIFNEIQYYVSKDWSALGKIHSIATFALFLFQETNGEYFIKIDETGEAPIYSLAYGGVMEINKKELCLQ